jgi:hypothetical protein
MTSNLDHLLPVGDPGSNLLSADRQSPSENASHDPAKIISAWFVVRTLCKDFGQGPPEIVAALRHAERLLTEAVERDNSLFRLQDET